MRTLLALLAAVALAASGCNVKTEGAPCTDDDQCPSGQACGYNLVCSEAASRCPDPICREDQCDSGTGGPQECRVQDVDGICAKSMAAVACTTGQCGRVGRFADCLTVEFQLPASGTKVGPSGVGVTAKLTYPSRRFQPPDALVLMKGSSTTVGTIVRSGSTASPVTYTGTYTPTAFEGPISITASVLSQPQVDSPALALDVDNQAPLITDLQIACAGGSSCVRDDELTVSAMVADANLTSVTAALDLSPTQTIPLTSGGGRYSAVLSLRQWPFDGFTRAVLVTVTATDAQGNTGTVPSVSRVFSRARPFHDTQTGAAVTSPAVEGGGTIVFGVAASTGQLRGIDPDGTQAWTPTTLEITPGQGQPIKTAPTIGAVNIFAGSEDGRIYRLLLTGGPPASTPRAPTSTSTGTFPFSALFTPVLNTVLGVDHAYSAGGWAMLYQFYSDETVATLGVADPVEQSGAFADGSVFIVASTGTAATLRRFTDLTTGPVANGSVALTNGGVPLVLCDTVLVPLAVDGNGSILAACDNGQLHRVANAPTLVDEPLYQLPTGVHPSGSPVVLADGGILLPGSDGYIRRLVSGGGGATVDWAASIAATPGEFAAGVAAADPMGGAPAIYATTSQGRLVALNGAGTVRWSGVLEAGTTLGFPTIAPIPGGAPASALPTLYAGSSSGKLFRVVVDSGLDTAAPWPKAHHDVRNTGSSTSSLP